MLKEWVKYARKTYEVNDENRANIVKTHFLVYGIGIIVLIILAFLLFIRPLKKLKMDSEIEAYDVLVWEHEEYDHKGDYYYTVYTPTYYYKVNGKIYSYEVKMNFGSERKIYNKNTIYYDSLNPNNCVSQLETEGNIFIIIILGIISIYIFIVNTISLIMVHKYNKSLVIEINKKS